VAAASASPTVCAGAAWRPACRGGGCASPRNVGEQNSSIHTIAPNRSQSQLGLERARANGKILGRRRFSDGDRGGTSAPALGANQLGKVKVKHLVRKSGQRFYKVSQYVVVHFLTIKYLLTFFDAYQREQSNWATMCDIQISSAGSAGQRPLQSATIQANLYSISQPGVGAANQARVKQNL